MQAKSGSRLSNTLRKKSSPVAVLNPDHFFEQADTLMAPPAGAPRQVDLRRAISNAYYGVFHAILAAAADEYAESS